jgi:lipid-A-disaccharide synthase
VKHSLNLEAALAGMPFSMVYNTNFFNYFIGMRLINLDYVSLPNILMKKEVVKEFIQKNAKPEIIANDIYEIIKKDNRKEKMIENFKEIRKILNEKGASENAANIILNEI